MSESTLTFGTPILLGDNTIPGCKLPKEIEDAIPGIFRSCSNFGLDYFPTVVEFLTYDEISEVASYGGFPVRYPHWQFGMEYEELSKGYEFGMHRIYEMVVNCLTNSSHILTIKGSKAISDVVVGDRVLSGDGVREVVHVAKNSPSKVYRIRLREFSNDPVCTPNHKWSVLRDKDEPEWIEAKDLKPGDVLVGGGRYGDFLDCAPVIDWSPDKVFESTLSNVRWCLKDISPVKSMTRELAEFLGIVTGDGSSGVKCADNVVSVSVDKLFVDYQQHVANLFRNVFSVEPTVDTTKDNGAAVIFLCSKYAVDYLDSIGFKKGSTFRNKRIPSVVWASSNEYRAAYLRGLFDTDGYACGTLGMSCFNENLASDVQLMLLEMGIRSKVHRVSNNHNDISVVTIKGRMNVVRFWELVGFSLKYKSEQLYGLVMASYKMVGGIRLPSLQKHIHDMLAELRPELPKWAREFYWRLPKVNLGANTLWSFAKRMVSADFKQFQHVLKLLEKPMYEVEAVEDAGEQETVDIALDHDAHDFLANGLVSHNTNPCYIYCLDSNTYTDNVTVIAHALGHNDFFKNNLWFKPTSQNMMNEFANHRSRILRYMSRWGKEVVGEFIDWCLAIETLIDPAQAWSRRKYHEPITHDSREYNYPRRLQVDKDHDYMNRWINPRSYIDDEWSRIKEDETKKSLNMFEDSSKDIMGFVRDNAPLTPWQADVLAMLYEEAMYFQPQRMTKMLNEGWACVLPDSLVNTNLGMLTAKNLVESSDSDLCVSDGKDLRRVSAKMKFVNRPCLRLRTRRGLEVEGSVTHRLLKTDGSWKRLDEFTVGDEIKLAVGTNMWPEGMVELSWQERRRPVLQDVAEYAGVSPFTVQSYRSGKKVRKADAIANVMPVYELAKLTYTRMQNKRQPVSIPSVVDECFASFLGHSTGDGHISEKKRTIGFTNGVEGKVRQFAEEVESLFGLTCNVVFDSDEHASRWRASFSSKTVEDFLVYLGLPVGVAARRKKIPDCILRSPKDVMSSFIRSYFDCDAYAGPGGIILSTSSEEMTKQLQIILLNYGILSRKYLKDKGNWHVHITGKSAKVFFNEIGFGLTEKQAALHDYVVNRRRFLDESDSDKVVAVEDIGCHDVYDMTVEETHRYVAQGLINHNSFIDFNIMARLGMPNCDIIEYAAHKAGVLGGKTSMNPYKLGFELFLWIEECWNKGKFGRDYEDCQDNRLRENWDKKLGLGHEKVFEVRAMYDDVTALAQFFDQEFCDKHKFYLWKKFPSNEPGIQHEWRIESRNAKKIKKALMMRYMNGGLPTIKLVDPNFRNKGIMMLEHSWDGRTLHPKYAQETLVSLYRLWQKPCAIVTKNKDEQDVVLYCSLVKQEDGKKVPLTRVLTKEEVAEL